MSMHCGLHVSPTNANKSGGKERFSPRSSIDIESDHWCLHVDAGAQISN